SMVCREGQLKLTFRILSSSPHGHYEFRWGADPANPSGIRGLFTSDSHRCDKVLKLMQSKVEHRARVATGSENPPQEAQWQASCSPEARYGTVLIFRLNIEPALK